MIVRPVQDRPLRTRSVLATMDPASAYRVLLELGALTEEQRALVRDLVEAVARLARRVAELEETASAQCKLARQGTGRLSAEKLRRAILAVADAAVRYEGRPVAVAAWAQRYIARFGERPGNGVWGLIEHPDVEWVKATPDPRTGRHATRGRPGRYARMTVEAARAILDGIGTDGARVATP